MNTDKEIELIAEMKADLDIVDILLDASRAKYDTLYASYEKLVTALEHIKSHDTHTVYGNEGNAFMMAKIAEQALKAAEGIK